MGRKAGTHPPAGLAHPGALCLWRWLRGIGFSWAGHLAAHPEFRPAASRACTSAPRPQPRSPSPHSCHSITPPSLLRAPEDPASSSLVEATCRAESFALEAPPRPKSPPHTPRLPFSRRLGQPGLSANPCPAFKTLEILYRTARPPPLPPALPRTLTGTLPLAIAQAVPSLGTPFLQLSGSF